MQVNKPSRVNQPSRLQEYTAIEALELLIKSKWPHYLENRQKVPLFLL